MFLGIRKIINDIDAINKERFLNCLKQKEQVNKCLKHNKYKDYCDCLYLVEIFHKSCGWKN